MNLAFMLKVEESAPVPAITTPNAIHRTFNSAAQATILGPEDVYVKKGSTISLTCEVNVRSTPPSSVTWYQGGAVLDFDSPRGGISLETEKTDTGTTSRLLVTQARLTDSGNYTCVPSNANPASVMVHVLNGEHPAAMQHGGSCGMAPTILLASITLIIANLLSRGRYTFGKIVQSTAIDHFSLRFAVTRCVYSFVECSEATTRESQYGPKCSGPKLCEGRSDVADDL
ncbi:hypothetical protein ALC53_08804 [Atta colombica]|uniref:Ig-like domain-containing protein n=1 Tax=Atta colombica TaxID=520822 RepID=A0A195B8R6_9HYME|nr:hypothetical protein ALC53_08804 [Atta colombica]